MFVPKLGTKGDYMTRSIPIGLSGILEEFELERPELVTTADIARISKQVGIGMPARKVASRLKERGWLLATPQRGVWEFAPAEAAGPYSNFDPLLSIKAFALANPSVEYALTFQTAAWALGLADRVPAKIEVAFAERPKVKIPEQISAVVYTSNLQTVEAKGSNALAAEGIVVNLAQRPSSVRSWGSVREWLPPVSYELTAEAMLRELEGWPPSVWARTGYLLQGLRPDVAESIGAVSKPKVKIKFGARGKALRNDERWMVSDSVLPFDPRELESVK